MFILYVIDLAIEYYLYFTIMSYLAYTLAGRKMPIKKVLLWQIPASFIISTLFQVFYLFYIDYSGSPYFIFGHMLYMALEIMGRVLWIYFLFRDTDKKTRFYYASTVFTFSFFSEAIMMLWQLSADDVLIIRDSAALQGVYKMAAGIISVGITLFAAKRASKTTFWNKLQAFGAYPKLYIPMGLFNFLLFVLVGGLCYRLIPSEWIVFYLGLVYIVLLIVIVLLVSDLKKTENLNATRNLLLQQQNYIVKLESIQREIRSIQHDYKNMLSGLYAQASEGNTEAVKEFIDSKLLRVDEAVRDDLSQMNQLTRIELPELKGLVMTKMLEAERDKVPFRLEVMYPLNKCVMAAADLLRCVGILLDNAIEEARTQMDAAVTLLLLQEDAALTIVVKNPVSNKPDLNRIWNEGYSTKAAGRGVGLANYQSILRKYPHVSQETSIEGDCFVQVLVLAEG